MPFFERREKDRRGAAGASDTPERRSKDRRHWPFGVLYRTALAVSRVEDWLDQNTSGQWAIALEDVGEGFSSKTVKISFELESDKEAFVAQFGRHP